MVKEDTCQYSGIPAIQVEGRNVEEGIPMINIITDKKSFMVTPAVVDLEDEEKQPLNNENMKNGCPMENGRFIVLVVCLSSKFYHSS